MISRRLTLALLSLFCVSVACSNAQGLTKIHVDVSKKTGPVSSSWNYFGYDEPNYTYAANGTKLIAELAALSKQPVHIRTHFLLASGDGSASLKLGSTNAYTESPSGAPAYDWAIVDKVVDTIVNAGAIPFMEIGFMPKALSTSPEPYEVPWTQGAKNEHYFAGWTYPPNDYEKWSQLVQHWVAHSVERYGEAAVQTWDWEVWNEPDIGYWHGTPEEYDKLYDFTVAAVKHILPTARVGGPASTGPDNPKAAAFLKQFLFHCSTGRNNVTGGSGAPLDFISFHVKGRPQHAADHVVMGLSQEMKDAAAGFEIVSAIPQFSHLPIVLSEADPEGCAACSARLYPQNAYRNGPLYASYEAIALKTLTSLALQYKVNLQGVLTWAFEFENQPYFDGLRTLATNGLDKPVLNFFRMEGLMTGDSVQIDSSRALTADSILSRGVREQSDLDGVAARSDHNLSILLWNYQDEDVAGADQPVELRIAGMPSEAERVLSRQFRIDQQHSNSYALWKQMGSPQNPSPEQFQELLSAGQLQLLTSPSWVENRSPEMTLKLSLPAQSLTLLDLTW